MVYDTSRLISPIVGAVGAAVSINILSRTAQNVMQLSKPVKYQRKKQREAKFKIDNYWGVK